MTLLGDRMFLNGTKVLCKLGSTKHKSMKQSSELEGCHHEHVAIDVLLSCLASFPRLGVLVLREDESRSKLYTCKKMPANE